MTKFRTFIEEIDIITCLSQIKSSKQHISCLAIINLGKRTHRITILLTISHVIDFFSFLQINQKKNHTNINKTTCICSKIRKKQHLSLIN